MSDKEQGNNQKFVGQLIQKQNVTIERCRGGVGG